MEARLRRSDRDSERRGDIWNGQVEVVVEDDDRAHLRIEPDEAAFELVAIGDRRLMVGDLRNLDRTFELAPRAWPRRLVLPRVLGR